MNTYNTHPAHYNMYSVLQYISTTSNNQEYMQKYIPFTLQYGDCILAYKV